MPKAKEETQVEDNFIEEVVLEEAFGITNATLSDSEVHEIQAGLNVIAAAFPKDNAEDLTVDGVYGPKTQARLKQFIHGLPESTQAKLSDMDLPLVDNDSISKV